MRRDQVLVVEDEESIRNALMEYLKEHSHLQVEGARDGVDALHQVLTRRYAVVVLDMLMPKMSGTDFLDSLKAMISDPSLDFQGEPPAVIVVTGATTNDLPNESIAQRFPDVVRRVFRKPIDYSALAIAVEAELTRSPEA